MTKLLLSLLPFALALTACAALGDAVTAPLRPTVTVTRPPEPTTAPPDQVTPYPTRTPEPACIVDTGRDGDGWLNIRKAPNHKSAIVTTVQDGTRLVILTPGEWARVRFDGVTGYVNSEYCNPTEK